MRDSSDVSVHVEQKRRLWAVVAETARRQCGVVSLEQLLGAGGTNGQVRGLVQRGVLIPLHRGVYAVGHRPLLRKAYLIAALLAVGPDAFLSHRTAAAVYGLREVNTKVIDVTAPGRTRRSRGALNVHGIQRRPQVRTWNGLRVSSVPQMLIELAPQETERELDRLITACVRKNILDLAEVRRALDGRRGAAKLRAALAAYLPKPDRKSSLEVAFDEFLAEHPEIPEPERNVHIDGWEIDCYWPGHRLAVELDGRPYHVAVKDIERDRYKDAKLLLKRIRVLRITDTRFELDRQGVFDDLVGALGLS